MNRVPNLTWPTDEHGRRRQPENDEEAKRAGLSKIENVNDAATAYMGSAKASEAIAGGHWRLVPWPAA